MPVDVEKNSAEKNFSLAPSIDWKAIKIPAEAICDEVRLGDLILCGYRVPQECRKLSVRQTIWADTYWTVDKKIERDFQIQFVAVPERECRMKEFSQTFSRDDDDLLCRTSNWVSGAVYKIRFALEMPPLEEIANADLHLELRVIAEGKFQGVYRDPKKIEMNFSHTPQYRLDFPPSIYQNHFGSYWTAQQIEDITGGKWIVPPPENFFVRSFCRLIKKIAAAPKPVMYIATTYPQLAFHDIYFKQKINQKKKSIDSHSKVHEFADKISGVIVSHPIENLPPDFPQLLVEDSVRATFELTFAARKRFQGKVIAVTGSNGKTTTVAMLENILSKDRNIVATHNNSNVSARLTHAFMNYSNDKAYAVLEICSMALETEWGSITYGLMPHVAVITSITDAHLLEHGTMEGVARAKCNIFCGMAPGGFAVLNRDMPYFELIEKKATEHLLNVITFGTHPDAMIRMEKIQDGETFTCMGKSYVMNCSVPPEQIYDALAAVGVCVALAMPVEIALERLKAFKVVKGRGEIYDVTYKGKKIKLINGSYNATFLSIKTGFEYLNSIEKNPAARVAVLGDIAHLGDSAEKIHRQLAELIFKYNPDRVILCGKYMKILWQDIKDKCQCHWFESGQKLIPELNNLLNDGDCVFVKGSIPAKLSLVVDEILNGKKK